MNFNPAIWSRRLETIPAPDFVAGGAAFIAAVGVVDHFTGPLTLLTVFYLLPVAGAAWVVGRRAAAGLAVFAALTWALVDTVGPLATPKAPIAYVNDVSMLLVFVFAGVMVSALRDQLQRERNLIQDVQRHLLPAIPPLPNVEMSSRWIPAFTVGGDYYDVIESGPDQLTICLADVSGKGIRAALIMSNVQATIRALTSSGLAPERLMASLNRLLFQRIRAESFATVFYGVLNTATGRFTYCSAGHNPPLLCRSDGTVLRLESTGPVAGLFPAAEYHCVAIELGVHDCLVVYSDGVTEFENRAGEEFGEARLHEVLVTDPGRTAEETCGAIVDGLATFGGDRPYGDDLTMLVVRRTTAMDTTHAQRELTVPEALPIEMRPAADALEGMTLLVVDDHNPTLDLLTSVLRLAGARVLQASNAGRGFELLRQSRPHVVLSDIGMPCEDGLWFVRNIRRLPPDRGGSTPVIAVTAGVRGGDRATVLKSGFQAYLEKPTNPGELVATILEVAAAHGVMGSAMPLDAASG